MWSVIHKAGEFSEDSDYGDSKSKVQSRQKTWCISFAHMHAGAFVLILAV